MWRGPFLVCGLGHHTDAGPQSGNFRDPPPTLHQNTQATNCTHFKALLEVFLQWTVNWKSLFVTLKSIFPKNCQTVLSSDYRENGENQNNLQSPKLKTNKYNSNGCYYKAKSNGYIENNGGSKNLFPLTPKQKVGAYYNGSETNWFYFNFGMWKMPFPRIASRNGGAQASQKSCRLCLTWRIQTNKGNAYKEDFSSISKE